MFNANIECFPKCNPQPHIKLHICRSKLLNCELATPKFNYQTLIILLISLKNIHLVPIEIPSETIISSKLLNVSFVVYDVHICASITIFFNE